jgi:hypothetical protein
MPQLNCQPSVAFPDESYKIIGAAMAVHRYFGCGFTEKVYQDAFEVELKAVKEIDDMHRSQAINYAKVSKLPLAILINFGESSLRFERFPNRNNNS